MTDLNKDKGKKNDFSLTEAEGMAQKFVDSIDKLLASTDWGTSFFLKANKRRLEELRDETQKLLDSLLSAKKTGSEKQLSREIPSGCRTVYVSLFQSDANNMLKWQNVIKSIEKYSVSRPIYGQEEHVRSLIRSKLDRAREGYIITFVKETDIIKPYPGKKIQDRFGHELITLREGAISLMNIIEFVHNDKRYTYSPERGLVLIG